MSSVAGVCVSAKHRLVEGRSFPPLWQPVLVKVLIDQARQWVVSRQDRAGIQLIQLQNQYVSTRWPRKQFLQLVFQSETDIRSHKRRLTTLSKYESKKKPENANATIGVLCDDQFYNDIDLDEFEAQATPILKQNLDLSI